MEGRIASKVQRVPRCWRSRSRSGVTRSRRDPIGARSVFMGTFCSGDSEAVGRITRGVPPFMSTGKASERVSGCRAIERAIDRSIDRLYGANNTCDCTEGGDGLHHRVSKSEALRFVSPRPSDSRHSIGHPRVHVIEFGPPWIDAPSNSSLSRSNCSSRCRSIANHDRDASCFIHSFIHSFTVPGTIATIRASRRSCTSRTEINTTRSLAPSLPRSISAFLACLPAEVCCTMVEMSTSESTRRLLALEAGSCCSGDHGELARKCSPR